MSEQTVMFSVDTGLKDAFAHAAEKNACNETELLKAFMVEYVQQEMRSQHYEDWFRRKVAIGLDELEAGMALSHEEANAQVEAFKASLKGKLQGDTSL